MSEAKHKFEWDMWTYNHPDQYVDLQRRAMGVHLRGTPVVAYAVVWPHTCDGRPDADGASWIWDR